jgi:putative transposase
VIYLDALVVKVRDGAHVRNKAAHIAIGVDLEGVKNVLGSWVQTSEGAKFWAGVCAELANRGVRDVLIVCCDGLSGFAEAIEATWTQATVQTSSIDTGWWRDGLAGHRATRRGPMQTRAFEALMQTCPSWWRRVA